MQKIRIGASDMIVSAIGIGAMAWGESKMWGYGADLGYEEVRDVFAACVEGGVNFFDTAEVYGSGRSEQNVGRLLKETTQPVYIATKFAPLPWRFSARSLSRALDKSLSRMDLKSVDLYQIHFPMGLIPFEKQWNALADIVESGKARYVGVSNYSTDQMLRAYELLAKRGVKLVSNQVEYSLIHRSPEADGLLDACRELDITLIAYSPLGRGVLSGKYKPGATPPDMRRSYGHFRNERLEKTLPLIETLRKIGEDHGGKTPAQVALNWLVRQPNVLAIPGAKNVRHVQTSIDSISWEMSEDEAALINEVSSPFRQAIAYKPLG
jgi:aryl-alcohol dehydrogenase-like predicted oxidoreductase